MRAIFLLMFFWASLAYGEPIGHDRALEAVRSGEIMPLQDILAKATQRLSGTVVSVSLTDGEAGLHGWVYDVKIYADDGRLLLVRLDATTGSILQHLGQDGF